MRQLALMALQRAGYRVTLATGSGEALAIVTARPDIDLALVDVVLPDMSGLDLAAALREASPRIRIIFMSGFTSDHFKLAVDDPCLTKPFTIETLTQVIEKVLRTRNPRI